MKNWTGGTLVGLSKIKLVEKLLKLKLWICLLRPIKKATSNCDNAKWK
jgi:hypothetical protein